MKNIYFKKANTVIDNGHFNKKFFFYEKINFLFYVYQILFFSSPYTINSLSMES
jgi:hypothetical protein